MSRFERFMEAVGLLTMDLLRSGVWWRRWLGSALGALAVAIMLPLMWWGRKPK